MAMPELTYQRFKPSSSLAPYVEHFWLVHAPGEEKPRREILIPNGRPMLLLSFAKPSTRIDLVTNERASNANALAGIITQPFVIEQFGEARYLGVQFKPHGLSPFVRGTRLVNQLMPIEQWLGEPQAAQLMNALMTSDFGQDRAEALDRYLQSKIVTVEQSNIQMLEAAIDRIEQVGGQLKVEELAEELGTQYAMFYRIFKNYVGLRPKQFLDIVRYYSFVGSLLNPSNQDSNALIAALQGYYDQAHASKEFKRFTGMTPNTFKNRLNNIARLMHQE
jgi:AraC-like DNA-binding protein